MPVCISDILWEEFGIPFEELLCWACSGGMVCLDASYARDLSSSAVFHYYHREICFPFFSISHLVFLNEFIVSYSQSLKLYSFKGIEVMIGYTTALMYMDFI